MLGVTQNPSAVTDFLKLRIQLKKFEKSEMSLNLKQVKGNFQRLFDKNLTDLVRGLRNNKDNEVNEVSPL